MHRRPHRSDSRAADADHDDHAHHLSIRGLFVIFKRKLTPSTAGRTLAMIFWRIDKVTVTAVLCATTASTTSTAALKVR